MLGHSSCVRFDSGISRERWWCGPRLYSQHHRWDTGGRGGFSTRLIRRESEEIRVVASHHHRQIAGDSSRAGCSRVPRVLVSGWGIWQRTHLQKPCLSTLISSLIGAHQQWHLLGSSTTAAKQCHRGAPRQAASGCDECIGTRDEIEAARDGASSTSFSPMFY